MLENYQTADLIIFIFFYYDFYHSQCRFLFLVLINQLFKFV